MNDGLTINLRKWHLIIGLAMGIMIPSVSVVAAWYSKDTAVKEMIHAVEQKMAAQKLENERRFAKQEDLRTISKALQNISSTLVELKTDIKYLKRTKR